MSILADLLGRTPPVRQVRAQDGQGLVEYGLIISLVAIIAILALITLGGNVTTLLSATGQSV